MKKLVLVAMLIMTMSFGLVGCGTSSNRNTDEVKTEQTDADSMVHLESAEEASAFLDTVLAATPSDVMPDPIQTELLDLGNMDTITYMTGLTDVSGIEDITVSNALIMSTAYNTFYVRTKEGADSKEIAKAMMENINPRRWICVTAEKQLVASVGDDLVFIMGREDTVKAIYESLEKEAKNINMKVSLLDERTNLE